MAEWSCDCGCSSDENYARNTQNSWGPAGLEERFERYNKEWLMKSKTIIVMDEAEEDSSFELPQGCSSGAPEKGFEDCGERARR